MKRYLLFLSNGYEALGGWDDFKADFDVLEDALLPIIPDTLYSSRPNGEGYVELNGERYDSAHVVDMNEGGIVARFYGQHGNIALNHSWDILNGQLHSQI